MVAGSLLTRSPLFYEVKPSVHSKLAVIPLTIFNNYSVPVAITRIGIPDAAATLLSTSDKASTRRFTVCVTFSPHSQLTRSFSAFAPPKRPFSPLYFVFHVARFRSQLWVRGAGVTSRQRSVFSAVVAVTTNLTSFSVELVAYDGLLSVYSSSSVITTAWAPLAFLPRSSFQQDSINWDTRLPFSYTAAFSASSLLLDMGFLHPGEHRYQTLVLYNRNPVPVAFTLHSPTLPQVAVTPVYRSTLTNQTATQAFTPGSSLFIASSRLVFALPARQLQFAPWEYMIFLVDVCGAPAETAAPSLPPITLYHYKDVVTGENPSQHVGACCVFKHIVVAARTVQLPERLAGGGREQHGADEGVFRARRGLPHRAVHQHAHGPRHPRRRGLHQQPRPAVPRAHALRRQGGRRYALLSRHAVLQRHGGVRRLQVRPLRAPASAARRRHLLRRAARAALRRRAPQEYFVRQGEFVREELT